jgi:hypothetical protein
VTGNNPSTSQSEDLDQVRAELFASLTNAHELLAQTETLLFAVRLLHARLLKPERAKDMIEAGYPPPSQESELQASTGNDAPSS